MKKTVFAIFIFYATVATSAFTIKGNSFDTLSNEYWIFHKSVITNDSDDSIEITIIKKPIFLPEFWQASICFGPDCLSAQDDTAKGMIAPHDSSEFEFNVGLLSDTLLSVYTPVILIEIRDNNSPPNIQRRIFSMSNQETPSLGIISWNTESEQFKIGEAETVTAWENTFYNNSSQAQSFYIKKSNIVMPDEWSSSLCVDLDCLSSDVDSMVITDVQPNDSVLVEFDVATGTNAGTAYAMLEVGSIDSPLEKKRIVFGVQTEGTSIQRLSKLNKSSIYIMNSIKLSPNYLSFFSTGSGKASFSLIDVQGRQIIPKRNLILTKNKLMNVAFNKTVHPGWHTLLIDANNQREAYPVLLMKK